jgi:hypothetical protein
VHCNQGEERKDITARAALAYHHLPNEEIRDNDRTEDRQPDVVAMDPWGEEQEKRRKKWTTSKDTMYGRAHGTNRYDLARYDGLRRAK